MSTVSLSWYRTDQSKQARIKFLVHKDVANKQDRDVTGQTK